MGDSSFFPSRHTTAVLGSQTLATAPTRSAVVCFKLVTWDWTCLMRLAQLMPSQPFILSSYKWHLGIEDKSCPCLILSWKMSLHTKWLMFPWLKFLDENFRLIILPSCGFLKRMVRIPSSYLARLFLFFFLTPHFSIACLLHIMKFAKVNLFH